MALREDSGVPAIDVMMSCAAVQDLMARRIRYGETRLAEALLAAVMVAIGIGFLSGGDTLALPSFRIIRVFVSEAEAGWLSLAAGSVRLWALWMNGRQNMPVVRIAGCIGGVAFWSALAVGLYATSPPLVPLGPIALVLAAFEFVSLGRAARDAYVFDSLGLRRRARRESRPA